MNIPDRVPTLTRGRRFTDWVARNVPFGNDRAYFSVFLRTRDVSPSTKRVIPWLMWYVETEEGYTAFPLCRLPGAKTAELWDPEQEEWLDHPGSYDDEDDE